MREGARPGRRAVHAVPDRTSRPVLRAREEIPGRSPSHTVPGEQKRGLPNPQEPNRSFHYPLHLVLYAPPPPRTTGPSGPVSFASQRLFCLLGSYPRISTTCVTLPRTARLRDSLHCDIALPASLQLTDSSTGLESIGPAFTLACARGSVRSPRENLTASRPSNARPLTVARWCVTPRTPACLPPHRQGVLHPCTPGPSTCMARACYTPASPDGALAWPGRVTPRHARFDHSHGQSVRLVYAHRQHGFSSVRGKLPPPPNPGRVLPGANVPVCLCGPKTVCPALAGRANRLGSTKAYAPGARPMRTLLFHSARRLSAARTFLTTAELRIMPSIENNVNPYILFGVR